MADEIQNFAKNVSFLMSSLMSEDRFLSTYDFAVVSMENITTPDFRIFLSPLPAKTEVIECGGVSLSQFVKKSNLAEGDFVSFSATDFETYQSQVLNCLVTDFIIHSTFHTYNSGGYGASSVKYGRGENYFLALQELMHRVSNSDGSDEVSRFFSDKSDLVVIFISDAGGDFFKSYKEKNPGYAKSYAEDSI